MINNYEEKMENNKSQTVDKKPNQLSPERKPNEHGGFYFSSFLKITDPNTNEVLVQKRGDN
jgi:hypothetical protein